MDNASRLILAGGGFDAINTEKRKKVMINGRKILVALANERARARGLGYDQKMVEERVGPKKSRIRGIIKMFSHS